VAVGTLNPIACDAGPTRIQPLPRSIVDVERVCVMDHPARRARAA
jgi:hypothetical protein